MVYSASWLGFLFVLLSLAVMIPPIRLTLSRQLSNGVSAICHATRSQVVLRWALLCFVFVLASIFLASATPLLGDGQLHVRELGAGHWESHPRIDRSPLTFWFLHWTYAWIKDFATPLQTYAWVSRVAGIGFLFLAARTSRVFAEERGERWMLFLILISQGYIPLFFGYVENYSLLFPLTLGYLILCKAALEKRVSVMLPAALLGLMVPMHFVTLAMAPAVVCSAIFRTEKEVQSRAVSLLGLGALPAIAGLLLVGMGLPVDALFRSEPMSHTLPLAGIVLHHQPYLLVSWDHAIEVVNQYALVAPGLLICAGIIPFAINLRDRTDVLLLLAALPLVTFTLLFNPEIGAFRDWDAFALPAIPLSILVGRWICRAFRKSQVLRQAVWVVLLVSAAHSILWIGVNADGEASERRYSLLLKEAGNSRYAQAYGAESLAAYYRDLGHLDDALAAFEDACRIASQNPRYHVGRAYVLSLMGDSAAAETALKDALVLSPDRLDTMINLGMLYLETGRLAEARSILTQAVVRNRQGTRALHALGMISYRMGDYEVAEGLFRRAAELAPENVTYRVDLGTALQSRGEPGKAEVIFREVLRMEPGSFRARMNLGAIYFEREDYGAASVVFLGVIGLDSTRADAHLNLGLTFRAMGEQGRARVHLRKALQLNPDDSEAEQIRNLLGEPDRSGP